MKVHFSDVGRDKHSWTSDVQSISGSELEKEVRKHTTVMSRDMDFLLNEEGTGGKVLVGGFRPIGTFRIDGGISVGRFEW